MGRGDGGRTDEGNPCVLWRERESSILHYKGLPLGFSTSLLGNPLLSLVTTVQRIAGWSVSGRLCFDSYTLKLEVPSTDRKKFPPEKFPYPFSSLFNSSLQTAYMAVSYITYREVDGLWCNFASRCAVISWSYDAEHGCNSIDNWNIKMPLEFTLTFHDRPTVF